ncbi:DUF4405 domain-containing protein [Candidatus Woesearchaeota archaeon]|nr:DUF4405 domain-containing protein [Candidatus Woesearchaeota archaeon]MBW3021975.1 DUF4405 domain-containing protein [Candidatus Woesearchaeota archaeon]
MNLLKTNIIVDIIAFVFFIPVTISSFVLYYIMPKGTGGSHAVTVLSLTRGEWVSAHYITGFIFIALMITHLILHWRFIKNIPGCLKHKAEQKQLKK